MNSVKSLLFLAMVVVVASMVDASAHKKETTRMFGPEGMYEGRFEGGRCMCGPGGYGEAGLVGGGPILPNKPYYGSAGYAQPGPPPVGGYGAGGYGNGGGYAVGGSYGGGSGQVSGGY